MNYTLVVLDIAGTTVKDSGNVADCFLQAFSKYGITVSREEVNAVMGFRKIDAIRLVLQRIGYNPAGAESLAEQIHEEFTTAMISFYENDHNLAPLPHAEALFRQLRGNGVKVALNTGFTRPITNAILKRLDWQVPGTIDAVICSDEVPQGRPHPHMIQQLMKDLDVSNASQVVKVGDTQVDVEEGRSARCGLVISVTSGAYSRQALQKDNPDAIIDDLAALPQLIS